jgi:hypothetical protein
MYRCDNLSDDLPISVRSFSWRDPSRGGSGSWAGHPSEHPVVGCSDELAVPGVGAAIRFGGGIAVIDDRHERRCHPAPVAFGGEVEATVATTGGHAMTRRDQ